MCGEPGADPPLERHVHAGPYAGGERRRHHIVGHRLGAEAEEAADAAVGERAHRPRGQLEAELDLGDDQHLVLGGQRLRSEHVANPADDPAGLPDLLDEADVVARIGEGHCRLQAGGRLTAARQLQHPLVGAPRVRIVVRRAGEAEPSLARDVRVDDEMGSWPPAPGVNLNVTKRSSLCCTLPSRTQLCALGVLM